MTADPFENLLAEVPACRRRLDVWKQRHGIRTERFEWEDNPWSAYAYDRILKLGYGVKDGMSLPELGAHVGRLIDEAGYEASAATEEDACYQLCQNLRLPWLDTLTREDLKL